MDLAFEAVGNKGRFQKILAWLVISVGSITLILSISFPFVTMQPIFLCREKENHFDSFQHCHEENLCRPDYDYKKDKTASLNNISYEFDLFCDRKYFVGLFGSAFFFGGIFGSIFLSPIPDRDLLSI